MILSLENVSYKYNDKAILDDVSFVVNEKEKWGIVGLNGSGKSTLLKIMAGVIKPDSGIFNYLKKYKLSYCPQESVFNNEDSVYDAVLKNLDEQYEDYKIKSILNKLGFDNYDLKIKNLSGGQKKRVALSIALIQDADLYLLDEVTNHLDQDMIIWLEKYLTKVSKAVVIVTHDRYFLNRITNHIVEIDDGKLYTYEGNYAYYLEQKEIRYAQAIAIEDKRQNFLRNEIEWIRAGAQARSTKQKARIEHYYEVLSQKGLKQKDNLELSSAASYLGKKTIEINNISKEYEGKILFRDFSYNLLKDDRIGIVGDNGSGKSTLLKIIIGEVMPDKGDVDIGETVKIGYFAQNNDILDSKQRVIDYLKEFGEYVYTSDGETISASKMLERFLFFKDDQYKPIEKCSGGEKRRLYLCSILMKAPNVLLLDEPTNDLDIETLTILENYLDDFKGAVLCVSHDRYFLDKVASHLFVFEDNSIKDTISTYSEYLESRNKDDNNIVKEEKIKTKTVSNKLSYKEKIELEKINANMPMLEEEIASIENELANITDYKKITELSINLDKLKNEYETMLERWIYLSEK